MILATKHFEQIEKEIQKLPNRLNFKIGAVSKILSTPAHALRYWEKEFPSLKPQKFINNQRLYTRRDISILLLIKILLYEEKFSTEGLRRHLPHYLKQMREFFKNQAFLRGQTQESLGEKPLEEKPPRLEQKAKDILITLSKIKSDLKEKSF